MLFLVALLFLIKTIYALTCDNPIVNNIQNCDGVFKYVTEELRGTFQVNHTTGLNLTVCLELGIPGKPVGSTRLNLAYEVDITEKRLKRKLPIRYFAYLPESQKPLAVVKIVKNGEVICENVKTTLGMNVFSITHTLWYPKDELTSIPVSLNDDDHSPRPCRLKLGFAVCERNLEELNSLPEVASLRIRSPATDEVKCGVATMSGRLDRGDHSVSSGEWPWIAEIYKFTELETTLICSATLISAQHVLTAATCFSSGTDNVLVILGQHNIHEWQNNNVIIKKPKTIISHSDYDKTTKEADLAIITFESVRFTDFIRPACLWNQNVDIDDMLSEQGVMALREYDKNFMLTKIPLVTNITLVRKKACKDEFKDILKLTAGSFCGTSSPGDIINGAVAAGGLYFIVNNQWNLRGIVWKRRREILYNPDEEQLHVFTDVSNYLPWINKELNKELSVI